MNDILPFLKKNLTPLELYTIFSRAFAGEIFLVEPSFDEEDSFYASAAKHILNGKRNRFWWRSLQEQLPFLQEDINHFLKENELAPLPLRSYTPSKLSQKHQLLREGTLSGDREGRRQGRFIQEKEIISLEEGTFWEGIDLLHGCPCLFFRLHEGAQSDFVYESILEISLLPNRHLVSYVDVFQHEGGCYVAFHPKGKRVEGYTDEEGFISIIAQIAYAMDSIQARGLPCSIPNEHFVYKK